MAAITRLQVYIVASFAALFIVAFRVISPHDGNFFRSIVALTISRWFNLALCNAGIAFLLASFWTTIRIFLDKLHPLEATNLQEKFFVFAAESILGIAMVRGTMSNVDAVLFLVTCAVSMVHVALVKRLNMLEEEAMPTTKRRIISASLLSGGLFVIDGVAVLWLGGLIWGDKATTAQASSGRSAGILLLLLLEWSLNIMQCITATTKLALMAFSARFHSEVTNSVRFYVEIFTELTRAVLYIVFGGMMLQQSTMPLHLVREILSNVKRIAVLIRDFVQHRKRMKWIEQVDTPTEEQLAQDRFCNICRDEVVYPSSARILPCSHLFHVDCLAKWLERNRDCPYCQRDVENMINEFVAARKRAENAAQQPPVAAAGEQPPQQQGGGAVDLLAAAAQAHAEALAVQQARQNHQQQQPAAVRVTTIGVEARGNGVDDNNNENNENNENNRPGLLRQEFRIQRQQPGAGVVAADGELSEELMRGLYDAYRKTAELQQENRKKQQQLQQQQQQQQQQKPSSAPAAAAASAANDDDDEPTLILSEWRTKPIELSSDEDDDDDTDFVLSRSDREMRNAAHKLEAYQRYWHRVESARKALKRELAAIRAANGESPMSGMSSFNPASPPAASFSVAGKSETKDVGDGATNKKKVDDEDAVNAARPVMELSDSTTLEAAAAAAAGPSSSSPSS